MKDRTAQMIRLLRRQLRMTQEEFAHSVAVTVSTVNRWENAHAEPSRLAWRAIRELARTRGVNGELFTATPGLGMPLTAAPVMGVIG
jgi:DNA-binding transcriptional regulator YiaG